VGRGETPVQKGFTPVEFAPGINFSQEIPPDFEPDATFLPGFQSPPACAWAEIALWQVALPRTGPTYPQDSFYDLPIIAPGPSSALLLLWDKWHNPWSLFVGEKRLRLHEHISRRRG